MFFEEPDEENLLVVWEFYANFPEHEDYVCTVRKKKVDFSKEAIQRAYNLLEYVEDPDANNYYFTHIRKPYTWRTFFVTICVPGKEVVWLKEGRLRSLLRRSDGYIINNHLMPSGNTTKVNGPWATLIWCFINCHNFDVAQAIQEEMTIHCPVQIYGFFFPSLVTRLCCEARKPYYEWESQARTEISG